MNDSVNMCDEAIESYDKDAKAKLYKKANLNEEKEPVKRKISIFYLHFYKLL